ncbi:MAG TPA: NAD(P)H-dependent oxidoreductase [Candidatus Saccharimonadales bacterium]|nr:NAD(P)H-dependent oxidoreductase [Candidatus Saccharimonadales bacterium]
MEKADGYIFITPEYNEGPSAVLKNAIDFLGFEANRKPAVIIGYSDGSNGGMYAPIQLRVNIGEVGMVALKAQVIVLNADKKISEEGVVVPEHIESMERRFGRLLGELFWFTNALKVAREKTL